jgi:fatty acid synthase subunit alpha, fungi type
VSTQLDEWTAAEVLKDEFTHNQSQRDDLDTTAQLENEAEATVELSARFLTHVAKSITKDPQSIHARTALLLNVLKYFTSTYLTTKDIHSLTSTFDIDTRKTVLSAYFLSIAALKAQDIDASIPKQPESVLLTAALSNKASVFALFGGQGTNEVYFDELQNLYEIYNPFVAPFVQTLTEDVLVPLVAKEEASTCYAFGLDVASWLSGATARPAVPYLASVPVSFPLIGLTQLVQYLVVCYVANLTPGELRSRISGATGHSQGIVSAVVIAASGTFEEFAENSRKAIKWLLYSGLRGQQAFPVTSVEPSIVHDAVAGGEGIPSPMLSIAGLTLKELQPHVSQTNQHLPATSQLHVSLHNGPKTFVVTGPSKALFGLVTSLRKIRAQSGLDQSKTPFSQRKPVFSIRFLLVGVPYHSDYLDGAADTVVEEDLEDEELWEAKDLKIPVYNTEDGTFLYLI